VSEKEVKKIFLTFDSHQEADEANFQYYLKLSSEEKIEIALDLMKTYHETYPRLERVFRFADLGECSVSSDRWMGI